MIAISNSQLKLESTRTRQLFYTDSNSTPFAVALWHNRTHSDHEIVLLSSVLSVALFHSPRMGNRFSERMQQTDQPYPRPDYTGASLQQDRDRSPQPENPAASSQQDENRTPQPGPPGASSQQDKDRNEGTCLSIQMMFSSMFSR